jgi:hypothetical protein
MKVFPPSKKKKKVLMRSILVLKEIKRCDHSSARGLHSQSRASGDISMKKYKSSLQMSARRSLFLDIGACRLPIVVPEPWCLLAWPPLRRSPDEEMSLRRYQQTVDRRQTIMRV